MRAKPTSIVAAAAIAAAAAASAPIAATAAAASITATTAVFTVLVKEGAVTGTLTSVADADLLGTEAGAGLAATTGARVSGTSKLVDKRIGYIGNKRYVQCNIKSTSTAAAVISCVAILGKPTNAPQTT